MKNVLSFVAVCLVLQVSLLAQERFGSAKLQIEIQTQPAITGVVKPLVRDGFVFMRSDSKPKIQNVGIVDVVTPLKSFAFTASDENRNNVTATQLTKTQIAISRPGKTWLTIYGLTADGDPVIATVIVEVQPIGPIDPDEPIEPDEPDEPDQDIPPGDGFRVLIVRETSELLPMDQQAILASPIIRNYLNSKTAKDGNQPEWRFLDKDSEFADSSSTFAVWMKRPRTQVPWVIISNGRQAFEGPLPANVEIMLQLLKKYGG